MTATQPGCRFRSAGAPPGPAGLDRSNGAREGLMFYVRQAYPTLGNSVPGDLWSLSHGIARQAPTIPMRLATPERAG